CATNVEVNVDLPHEHEHRLITRDEIVQGLSAAKTAATITVKFHDITVTVSGDGLTAQADVTVEVQVSGESEVVIQQMKFTLKKVDGKWLITKVQTVRPLS